MIGTKYIGMDVHKESISIAVRNSVSKVVMESVIETKAMILSMGCAEMCKLLLKKAPGPPGCTTC